MALNSFAGNFALNITTGSQAITGVGFTPKVVLFFPTTLAADGVTEHAYTNFGAAISASSQLAISTNSENAQSTTDTTRFSTVSDCMHLKIPGGGGTEYRASFISQNSDGFAINIIAEPDAAVRCGILALGGDDLTNVAIGNYAQNTISGSQAISGIGFQPTAIIFVGIHSTSVEANVDRNLFSLGFAISSTQRAMVGLSSRFGAATSTTAKYQVIDKCFAQIVQTGVLESEADFVSMDADGFTIDNTDPPPAADIVHFIALRGGQYNIGAFDSQTSTGEFSETNTGFQPTAGIFASFLNAAAGTVQDNLELSLGIATSSSERFAVGNSDEDNQGTSDADSYSDDARIYLNYDLNQAKEGDIDFVSFDNNGFTLDQMDADPIANQIIYFVVAPNAHHLIDFVLSQAGRTQTHEITFIVQRTDTQTHVIDFIVQRTDTQTHVIDFIGQRTDAKTHLIDFVLYQVARQQTHEITFIQQRTDTQTHEIDVALLRTDTQTYQITLINKRTDAQTYIVDFSKSSDAVIIPTVQLQGSHSSQIELSAKYDIIESLQGESESAILLLGDIKG